MLTKKEISKIQEHLNNSQNPIFLYDNDLDGLCSFALLSKWIERGKGVAIKSFPELDETYFKKVQELNGDYIFILDKPLVSKEFLEKAKQNNIPVVWIDHHETNQKIPKFVNYLNPTQKGKENQPTTYLCYEITKQKNNLWITIAGCISERFFPKEYKEFIKENQELGIKSQNPFQIYYESKIGKLARMLSFALKDRTSNVVAMQKILVNAKNPADILDENQKNKKIHKRFEEINQRYKLLIKNAKAEVQKSKNKIVLFTYSGDLSVSAELSNELSYLFKDKIIIVAYLSEFKVNLSGRGKNAKKILIPIIQKFENSSGGGHDEAIGARIMLSDLERLKEEIR